MSSNITSSYFETRDFSRFRIGPTVFTQSANIKFGIFYSIEDFYNIEQSSQEVISCPIISSSFYRPDYTISSFQTSLYQYGSESCFQAPFSFGIRGARSLRNRTDPYATFISKNRTNGDKPSWEKQVEHNTTGTLFPFGKIS